MKDRINIDEQFAISLDIGCANCGMENNIKQLKQLKNRGKTHPEEKRFTDALIDKCNHCLKTKEPTDSITARFSCMWRAGMK
ncbi:hypothetical protein JXA63_03870 [Candidatus Woesebacteria bacterium]|nr:hypothetical protein [Candidatus Woesebacteria bacterium]